AGPGEFAFGPLFVGLSRSLTVNVRNTGSDTLLVSSIASNKPDFVPSTASLTIPPRSSALLTVTFTPVSPGIINGSLTLQSNDPDSPVLVLPLSGEGLIPPDIAV